jgi:hypothetical protein
MDPKNRKAPAQNPANVNGLAFDGAFTIGNINIRSTATGVTLSHSSVGKSGLVTPKKTGGVPAATEGFGTNGELRLGKITLTISDDAALLRLRRENVGHYTDTDAETVVDLIERVFFSEEKAGSSAEREIAEAALEGVLDDAFFTRFIEKDGTVKTNLEKTREQQG